VRVEGGAFVVARVFCAAPTAVGPWLGASYPALTGWANFWCAAELGSNCSVVRLFALDLLFFPPASLEEHDTDGGDGGFGNDDGEVSAFGLHA
jgi:hypothetical protein